MGNLWQTNGPKAKNMKQSEQLYIIFIKLFSTLKVIESIQYKYTSWGSVRINELRRRMGAIQWHTYQEVVRLKVSENKPG
jgi:hypothetical protein